MNKLKAILIDPSDMKQLTILNYLYDGLTTADQLAKTLLGNNAVCVYTLPSNDRLYVDSTAMDNPKSNAFRFDGYGPEWNLFGRAIIIGVAHTSGKLVSCRWSMKELKPVLVFQSEKDSQDLKQVAQRKRLLEGLPVGQTAIAIYPFGKEVKMIPYTYFPGGKKKLADIVRHILGPNYATGYEFRGGDVLYYTPEKDVGVRTRGFKFKEDDREYFGPALIIGHKWETGELRDVHLNVVEVKRKILFYTSAQTIRARRLYHSQQASGQPMQS